MPTSTEMTRRQGMQKKPTMRRDTLQLSNRTRNIRRLRFRIYYFLDHPLNANSTWYHFGAFGFVLVAVILGATKVWHDPVVKVVHFYMEVFLAVFFICEFCVRMWCVSADAKYGGYKGRLRYLSRLVSLVDIIIIMVTIAMIYLEKTYISDVTLDYLQLIQILRLFHIDREMTTWRLIKDMVIMSKWELLATYYITFIFCLLIVNLVFITENEGFVLFVPESNSTTRSAEFPTLAHAWWFTMVTIPTIGYGDIVPSQWSSKVIVCTLGFLAYCTFVAASTQISVGLTLMMEENNKKECKNKLRVTSAYVIQFWYRFHLASDRERRMTEYFRRVCFKLYILAKQIRRNNQLAAKLREKIERKRKSGDTAPIENSTWKQQLSIGVAQQIIQTLNIEVGNGNAIQVAPDHWQEPKNVAPCDVEEDNETAQTDDDGRPQLLAYKPNASSRRGSTDTVISSSFDISDIETHIDTRNMYEQDRLDSVDISGVEEWILQKYRPLLRFFNFLLFREYSKKLRRLRKSDRLIEIEAEIREQENTRNQHLRELELRVNAMLGKPSTSSLSPTSNEKLCLSRRLDMCEAKMGEMENTMARINELIVDLTAILGDNPPQQVFLSTPSDRQAQSPSRSASDVSGEN